MPKVSQYAPGAPCWFELATTDQNGAKKFYSALFGWSIVDYPMGPDGVYTMFQLNGSDVGAASSLRPELREKGVPSHWSVYFATSDVDASAARVKELGGTVMAPPFDVMEEGRMSVCKDPGDAAFSLWQPKRHQGAALAGENGTVCWSELSTWDAGKVRDFYTKLFGWKTQGSANMATYIEFSVDGQPRGGLLPMDDMRKGVPAHWGIYFQVADCDATIAKAKELGAKLMHGPLDLPGVGRMAMMDDPQGAGFSFIKLG